MYWSVMFRLVAVFVALTSGCSSLPSAHEPGTASLEGVWKSVSFTSGEVGKYNSFVVTFGADGTVEWVSISPDGDKLTKRMRYRVAGKRLLFIVPHEEGPVPYEYELNGESLWMHGSAHGAKFEFIRIDD